MIATNPTYNSSMMVRLPAENRHTKRVGAPISILALYWITKAVADPRGRGKKSFRESENKGGQNACSSRS